MISVFLKFVDVLWGIKKIIVLGFNFVFGDNDMNFFFIVLLCCVAFCFKIMCRDDLLRRGVERICIRIISKVILVVFIVFVLISIDV